MVGLSGSLSLSCNGAGSSTFGIGAVCFAGGDLKDWSSFVNICVRVGAIFACWDVPRIMVVVLKMFDETSVVAGSNYTTSERSIGVGFQKGEPNGSRPRHRIDYNELDPAAWPHI